MATWNDIKLWMTSQNIIFTDFGEYVDLTWNYQDTKRSQQLRISHDQVGDGIDAITVKSPIALYNPLKTESLLLAANLGVGGVSLEDTNDGNRYFMLQTVVPISDLDASEIEFHVLAIAVRADWLEGEIFRVDNM